MTATSRERRAVREPPLREQAAKAYGERLDRERYLAGQRGVPREPLVHQDDVVRHLVGWTLNTEPERVKDGVAEVDDLRFFARMDDVIGDVVGPLDYRLVLILPCGGCEGPIHLDVHSLDHLGEILSKGRCHLQGSCIRAAQAARHSGVPNSEEGYDSSDDT